jgi:hypothetical protein
VSQLKSKGEDQKMTVQTEEAQQFENGRKFAQQAMVAILYLFPVTLDNSEAVVSIFKNGAQEFFKKIMPENAHRSFKDGFYHELQKTGRLADKFAKHFNIKPVGTEVLNRSRLD